MLNHRSSRRCLLVETFFRGDSPGTRLGGRDLTLENSIPISYGRGGSRVSCQGRTIRPRRRNIGAAISCKRTSASIFTGKGSDANRRRRASFADSTLRAASFTLSTPSTRPPVDAVSERFQERPDPIPPPAKNWRSAGGPCHGPSES